MSSTGSLAGKRALVTGAAGRIGGAIARRLAAEGARVAVTDQAGANGVEALATEIGGYSAPADLAVAVEARGVVRCAAAVLGGIDLLVANAAAMTMGALGEQDLDAWWHMIDVNLTGTFLLVQEAVPEMRLSGGGRIVVTTSEWGVIGWPGATGYCASKAGLIALVKSLGRELGPSGITVNGIAPGVVDTAQLNVDAQAAGVLLDDLRREYAARIPLGRLGCAEEIASLTAFLCGPFAGAMIGQIVQVNGGSSRGRP